MTTLNAALIVAVVLLVLVAGSVVVTVLDRKAKRAEQQAANLGDTERLWPYGAIDDPTPDEIEEIQRTFAEAATKVRANQLADEQQGDTLTLVGAELVHRRCADARRDGGEPGQCCAARLGVQSDA